MVDEVLPKPIIAIVAGTPITDLPDDLFIPPDALEILLDSFSGPLDLLLYLIRRQNIDILNIPILLITQQYMQYIQFIEEQRLEIAADYLVMAALLAEIKSKMLLPINQDHSIIDDEDDPRMALVRRLQLYEVFKEAAQLIDQLPRHERESFVVQLSGDNHHHQIVTRPHPHVDLCSLSVAMAAIMRREHHVAHHQIVREALSVRERMNIILQRLDNHHFIEFTTLFPRQEGRMGLVVSLLAILELCRQSLLMIIQTENFSPIRLKGCSSG
ncbi:MAG: segregation and condensation protein A [Legionella sp.]